jgi:hypothetical protein
MKPAEQQKAADRRTDALQSRPLQSARGVGCPHDGRVDQPVDDPDHQRHGAGEDAEYD